MTVYEYLDRVANGKGFWIRPVLREAIATQLHLLDVLTRRCRELAEELAVSKRSANGVSHDPDGDVPPL